MRPLDIVTANFLSNQTVYTGAEQVQHVWVTRMYLVFMGNTWHFDRNTPVSLLEKQKNLEVVLKILLCFCYSMR